MADQTTVTVALPQVAWQQIVNLLDQERNVVKAMPRDTSPIGLVLDYIQDAVLAGMTETIDSICRQAGVVPGQNTRE